MYFQRITWPLPIRSPNSRHQHQLRHFLAHNSARLGLPSEKFDYTIGRVGFIKPCLESTSYWEYPETTESAYQWRYHGPELL